ncbi:MAG: hypothetical protein WC241_00545 [Candidatus Paceibacterota bacterium]|jgi:hypothetical protein
MKMNQIKEKLNKIVESKNFRKIIYILGTVFILALVFQAGMMVGFRKASFVRDWGNNYERNFGPNREIPRFLRDGMRDIPNANGAIGKIIKVEFPNITVLDKDQTEKVVIIKDDTSILERKEILTKDSLTVDKFIIVIGSPNGQGQIEAKLIRIMPNPEGMMKLNMNGFNSKNI